MHTTAFLPWIYVDKKQLLFQILKVLNHDSSFLKDQKEGTKLKMQKLCKLHKFGPMNKFQPFRSSAVLQHPSLYTCTHGKVAIFLNFNFVQITSTNTH